MNNRRSFKYMWPCLLALAVLFIAMVIALQYFPNVEWSLIFEALSATGAVLVPFAILYIDKKTELTRIAIEEENARSICEMKKILDENQKVLDSIKEFENTYGDDIKSLAKFRESGKTLLTGIQNGTTLTLTSTNL